MIALKIPNLPEKPDDITLDVRDHYDVNDRNAPAFIAGTKYAQQMLLQEQMAQTKAFLATLTTEQRLEVIGGWCTLCGDSNPCYCQDSRCD